jgi:hypothetical protein
MSETECRYVVAEGTIVLTLPDGSVVELIAPSAVVVTNGVAGAITPVPFDAVFGDSWLTDNASRDAAAGFADAATIYRAHGPAYGSLAGTYIGEFVVTEQECANECSIGIGTVVPLELVIEATATGVSIGSIPVAFDGSSYTYRVDAPDDECFDFNDVQTGSISQSFDWTLTPTTVQDRDGQPIVVALDVGVIQEIVISGDCFGFGDERNVAEGTATR